MNFKIHQQLAFALVTLFGLFTVSVAQAQSSSCGFFDRKAQFRDGPSVCLKEFSFLNRQGLIAGEPTQSYTAVADSKRSYAIAVTRDPQNCPFAQYIAWDWSGSDAREALPKCDERLKQALTTAGQASNAALCQCEIILDNGKSALTRAEFSARTQLYERQIALGNRALNQSEPKQAVVATAATVASQVPVADTLNEARKAEEARLAKAAEEARNLEAAKAAKAAADARQAEELRLAKATEDAQKLQAAKVAKAAADARQAEELRLAKAAEDAQKLQAAKVAKAAEDARAQEQARLAQAAEEARVLARAQTEAQARAAERDRQTAQAEALATAARTKEQNRLAQAALEREQQLQKNQEMTKLLGEARQRDAELVKLREQMAIRELETAENLKKAASPTAAVTKLTSSALVIGNSAYISFQRLPNPKLDAQAMADKLRSFGIQVDLIMDADRDVLVKALNDYAAKAVGKDVNLLFYAGHGIQVDGVNYLIPINMKADGISAGYIKLSGIALNVVLDYMPAKTRLVFLDACRDNPASRSLFAARGGASVGLAPVSAATGTLIAYATKEGMVAADGNGRNSPYTTALLKHLDAPLDISIVMRRVRKTVLEMTSNTQEPWEYGSLIGDQLILSQMAK
jgi:hypothetical protein